MIVIICLVSLVDQWTRDVTGATRSPFTLIEFPPPQGCRPTGDFFHHLPFLRVIRNGQIQEKSLQLSVSILAALCSDLPPVSFFLLID